MNLTILKLHMYAWPCREYSAVIGFALMLRGTTSNILLICL